MASIRKRDGKNGSSYQVQVRIKGGGVESASFKSLTKAKIWAQSVESKSQKRPTFGYAIQKDYRINKVLDSPE